MIKNVETFNTNAINEFVQKFYDTFLRNSRII